MYIDNLMKRSIIALRTSVKKSDRSAEITAAGKEENDEPGSENSMRTSGRSGDIWGVFLFPAEKGTSDD